ncbi:response regulator [Clostridium paraputrificum]|uniref:HD domain-containing phosphohydrolase n=1 Tax=Clostridium paraputrificum TaxID=29363 RepID=UPI001899E601|nr:HD domain-containing phosphohydrolase [Clostridium paraputrificum]MDC0803579.1 response regulator [Clostridium paraputrificum]
MKDFNLFYIDDCKINHDVIASFLKNIDINIEYFYDAISALKCVNLKKPDIIIVDYIMPKMNGLEFIKNVRSLDKKVPIILITAASDESIKLKALESGATEFLYLPFNKYEFIMRIKNLLELIKYQRRVENKASILARGIKEATASIMEREKETLEVLVETAKKKDSDTGNHVVRVAKYSKLLARVLGMSEEEQEEIYYAAQLHDLGKIGISDQIINKRCQLTLEEFEIMKTHTIIGYDILKNRSSKYLKKGSIVALSHHERYDGLGYPNGLKGNEIPIEGRIVSIADVFDALLMKRSYKNSWSIEEAIDYIKGKSGTQFDPYLVDRYIDNIEEIRRISYEFKD